MSPRFLRRLAGGGAEPIDASLLLPDDSVAVALAVLARELKDAVYMWCSASREPLEALWLVLQAAGVAAEDRDLDSARVNAAAREVFGVRALVRPKAKGSAPRGTTTREEVLEALKRAGDLREPVACGARFRAPARPFSRRVDPFDGPIPTEGMSRVDTSNVLLENFPGVDEFHVVTRGDLVKIWMGGASSAVAIAAADALLGDQARLDATASRELDRERGAIQYAASRDVPGLYPASPASVTYIRIGGERPFEESDGRDVLATAFAEMSATAGAPLVRLASHVSGAVFSRVHETFPAERVAGMKTPKSKHWLQVAFAAPGLPGLLTLDVFQTRFVLHAAFPATALVDEERIAAAFPRVNEALARISPFFSVLGERTFALTDNHVNPHHQACSARVLDMFVSLDLKSATRLCQPSAFGAAMASATSVLVPASTTSDLRQTRMLLLRSPLVTRDALVLEYLRSNASSPLATKARRVSELFAMPLDEAQRTVEMLGMSPTQPQRITGATVARKSDSIVSVRIEHATDWRQVDRIERAVKTVVADCARARPPVAGSASTAGLFRHTAMAAARAGLGVGPPAAFGVVSAFEDDLDDYMDIAGSQAEAEAEAPAPAGPDVLTGLRSDSGGDVLRALRAKDPALFPSRADGVYRPYSVLCQKRQPVRVEPADFERVSAESTGVRGSVRFGSSKERDAFYICPDRWCVTSGVARRAGEECPLPDEPVWDLQSGMYPGLIGGVQHPDGLCMPCCFKKEPKPGSKVGATVAACRGEVTASAGTAHVSRASRLLEPGAIGRLSDAVKRHVGPECVRVGLGNRNTFLDAVAFAYGAPDARSAAAALAGRLTPAAVMCGRPRALLDVAESAEDAGRMLVENARAALRAPPEKVGHREWLRVVNEAREADAPELLVLTENAEGVRVSLDEAAGSDRRGGGRGVSVLLEKDGRYEPVVKSPKDRRFHFDRGTPWVAALLGAARDLPDLPPPLRSEKHTRLLSATLAVVAVQTEAGVVPLRAPVPFTPAARHKRLAAVPAAAATDDAMARRVFRETRDAFFKDGYRQAAKELLAEAKLNESLQVAARATDRRSEVAEEVNAHIVAMSRHAAAVKEVIGADDLLRTGADSVAVIRKKHSAGLRKETGLQDHVLDYIIERLMRPVRVGVVPFVSLGGEETLVVTPV